MKKLSSSIRIALISLSVLGTGLTSCSQEEIDKLINQQQNNNNTTPTPPSGSIPLPEFADAHGVLAVTKTKTVQSGLYLTPIILIIGVKMFGLMMIGMFYTD